MEDREREGSEAISEIIVALKHDSIKDQKRNKEILKYYIPKN